MSGLAFRNIQAMQIPHLIMEDPFLFLNTFKILIFPDTIQCFIIQHQLVSFNYCMFKSINILLDNLSRHCSLIFYELQESNTDFFRVYCIFVTLYCSHCYKQIFVIKKFKISQLKTFQTEFENREDFLLIVHFSVKKQKKSKIEIRKLK